MAPRILLVRHGHTEWALSGRHTGLTDVPLTAEGRHGARLVGERLHRAPWYGLAGAEVRTSPLSRASDTCALAGFKDRAASWDALLEWDYGEYEGLTSEEIQAGRPGWLIWRDGVVGGESISRLAARADEVVRWARSADRDVLLFSSGHILRAVAARWLGEDPSRGAALQLSPASFSILGWAYGEPAIERWNDTAHLECCQDGGASV